MRVELLRDERGKLAARKRRTSSWAGSLAFHAVLLAFVPCLLLVREPAASAPTTIIVRHAHSPCADETDVPAGTRESDEPRVHFPGAEASDRSEARDDDYGPVSSDCILCYLGGPGCGRGRQPGVRQGGG